MKSYGLPRNMDVERPDKLDCITYALKSSRGGITRAGDDIRSQFRVTKQKQYFRRVWKKKERLFTKQAIREQVMKDGWDD